VPADYQQSGSVYTSPAYARADERIELRINGGVGNVRVETD
jgi:hypothetical protein